jgi:hypothetical protein
MRTVPSSAPLGGWMQSLPTPWAEESRDELRRGTFVMKDVSQELGSSSEPCGRHTTWAIEEFAEAWPDILVSQLPGIFLGTYY